MAMPWTRAKQIAAEYRSGVRDVKHLTALFDACFRIQREASEAAGHHIPLVVENVRGAQPWVGRSRWNFGSFHLWGDVPALMPMTNKRAILKPQPYERRHGTGSWFAIDMKSKREGVTDPAQVRRISEAHRSKSPAKGYGQVTEDGLKQAGISGPRANGKGDAWFQDGAAKHGSKSKSRKAASAHIAKIPITLSQHIARAWKPECAA